MWIPRKSRPLRLGLELLSDSPHLRFNYCIRDPTKGTQGALFVQMLSTMNPATVWSEFQTKHTVNVAQLPSAIDPSLIVQ